MAPYLQHRHHPDLETELTNWLAHPCAPGFQSWALADVSILGTQILRELERLSPTTCAVLEGSRYTAYDELGPRLVSIDANTLPFLRKLLSLSDGLPALSFVEIACPDGMPRREALAALASVETEDGMEMFCRISDTRVLPAVLATLDRDQSDRLAQSVRRWAWIDRSGRLECQAFEPPTTTEDHVRATLTLNDIQYSTLMRAAEPDILHRLLHDISPEVIPDMPRADVHKRLSALLETAREYGIHDTPDQLQFVTIAWSTSESFHTLSCLETTWGATRNGELRFRDAVANWPDAVWEQIEATHVARIKSPA